MVTLKEIRTNISRDTESNDTVFFSYAFLLIFVHIVNQKIAVGVLKKLGYEDVDVAENGLEVIDKLDAGRVYDVILVTLITYIASSTSPLSLVP